MTDVIREGFLCPLCKLDFGSANELLNHADSCTGEKQDKIKSTAFDYSEYEAMRTRIENVPANSLTDAFKKERFGCPRQSTLETNRLFFRLDRLVDILDSFQTSVANSSSGRRSFGKLSLQKQSEEQRVCDWTPDADRPQCARCQKRFTLQRRKHHCRLCGEVICDSCSLFLAHSDAKYLLELNRVQGIEQGIFARDISNESAAEAEAAAKARNELTTRICTHCSSLLEARRHERDALRESALQRTYRTLRAAIDALIALRDDFDAAFERAAVNDFRNSAERARLESLRNDVVTRANDLERAANECYPAARLTSPDVVDNTEMRIRRNLRALAYETSRDIRFTLRPVLQTTA